MLFRSNNKKEMSYIKSEKVSIGGKDVTIKTYKYLADGTTITDIDRETGKATQITVGDAQKDFKASVKTATISTIKDSELSFWTENLVVEDGSYILSVKADVEDWINKKLSGK